MEEKKCIKMSIGTAICLFIIVILLIALGFTYYLGFVKNNEKNLGLENQKTFLEKALEKESSIAKEIQTDAKEIEKKVKENTLQKNNTNSEAEEFYENALNYVSMKYGVQAQKIRIYNVGTGINPTLFIITKTGEVYEVYSSTGNFKLNEALKNYKVEDILSQTGETNNVFDILLKDGNKKQIIENLDN